MESLTKRNLVRYYGELTLNSENETPLKQCLKDSKNLYAEIILKYIFQYKQKNSNH